MFNFKENYLFSRFQIGSNTFQGRGPTFFRGGGGQIAYSLKKPIKLVIFQGGPDPLSPHLDPLEN